MNIALVKLSSLGDVVHALPVAATLRARLPAARLTWVAEAREAALLRGHPALECVVPVDTRGWRRPWRGPGLRAALREMAGVRRRLRGAAFDVAIDLQGLVKSGLVAAATAAPERIGFAARRCREPLAALFTTRRVDPPPGARHVVEQCLALAAALAPGPPVLEFSLPVDPAAEERADALLGAGSGTGGAPLVVLNVGAGRADKRWPPARFGALCTRLAAERALRILVLWGPGEHELGRQAVAGSDERHVLLAAPTGLPDVLALLRRAAVVVAADTGPLHLAAALGRPCVGLYGPTSGARNGPWGSGHRVLQAQDGRVASIGVEPVAAAVAALLP